MKTLHQVTLNSHQTGHVDNKWQSIPWRHDCFLYKHDRAMDATRLETASHCTHNICGVFAVHHCVPGLFAGGVSVHDSCCTI